MRHTLILPAALALAAGASLLTAHAAMKEGEVTRRPDGSMHVATPKGEVTVTPYSNDIFRITVLPFGRTFPPSFFLCLYTLF